MKNLIVNAIKIVVGIFTILIPFFLVLIVAENIHIHDYSRLKWVALFISGLGFYISGLINRRTPLKWIPFLYISLLLFYPIRCVYFPLIIFIILFATISLFITRKEFEKKYKLLSIGIMGGLFIYFLFSQPLIIRNTEEIKYVNGELQNSLVVWDFSKEKRNMLPERIFYDKDNKSFELRTLKNKTLYITFWATWCVPCMEEKTELEKLKNHFKDNSEIVFVDILLDDSKGNWLRYLQNNKPKGLQLRSGNAAKTRELFDISGIPVHIVVNAKGLYRKERNIINAYNILADKSSLNNFINRTEKKENIEFIFAKITDEELRTFDRIENIDTTEYFMSNKKAYKVNDLVQNYLDNTLLENQKERIEIPKYVYFAIENTIHRNDSIINIGYFKNSDIILKKLN